MLTSLRLRCQWLRGLGLARQGGCVWKCCVPLNPMVLLIIIPIKWLFHWEYTLFSDKPMQGGFWTLTWLTFPLYPPTCHFCGNQNVPNVLLEIPTWATKMCQMGGGNAKIDAQDLLFFSYCKKASSTYANPKHCKGVKGDRKLKTLCKSIRHHPHRSSRGCDTSIADARSGDRTKLL